MKPAWTSLWRGLVAAAAASLTPAVAAAAIEVAASDAGARMLRLADNVFVIEHDDATDEWPHGNTGVIVGQAGLFVIDSCYLPSRARADIALIRRVTRQAGALPHDDALAFRPQQRGVGLSRRVSLASRFSPSATPRAGSSSTRNTGRHCQRRQPRRGAPRSRSSRPKRGRRSAAPSSPSSRRSRSSKPTFLFDGRLSLDFEGTPIEIEDRGRANSPNDATIWLPRERILFAGDILVRSPLPYVGASWPVHWVSVLRDLEAVPAAAIVPGHGPVQTDHAYTRSVRELLEATLERVEALVRAGRSLAEVQDMLALDDVRQARARLEWPCSERRRLDLHATNARGARVHGRPRTRRALTVPREHRSCCRSDRRRRFPTARAASARTRPTPRSAASRRRRHSACRSSSTEASPAAHCREPRRRTGAPCASPRRLPARRSRIRRMPGRCRSRR